MPAPPGRTSEGTQTVNIDRVAAHLPDPMVNALKTGVLYRDPSASPQTVRALARRGLVTETGGGFFRITEEGLSALLHFAVSPELRQEIMERLYVAAKVDDRDLTLPACDCQHFEGPGHAVACRRRAPLLDKDETPDADTIEHAYAEDLRIEAESVEAQGKTFATATNIVLSRRAVLAETDKEARDMLSLDHYVRFGEVPFPAYTLRHRLYSERLTAALAQWRQVEEEPAPPVLTVVPSRVTSGLPFYTEVIDGETFNHLSVPTWHVTVCGRKAPGEHGSTDTLTEIDCLDCLDRHTKSLVG